MNIRIIRLMLPTGHMDQAVNLVFAERERERDRKNNKILMSKEPDALILSWPH